MCHYTVLTISALFHYLGKMETSEAVVALEALAQETRLGIFRLLVETGPKGPLLTRRSTK
jgi:hypothetical protein